MLGAKALWKSEKGRAVAEKAAHMVLTMVLSAGKLGGLYGPWALAAVALSGGRSRGFFSVLGALLGAYCFYDFQSGPRLAASAVLIYCANMAFGDMKIAKRPAFAPALAAAALLLVQSVYLVGRTAQHWALCFAAAGVTAGITVLLKERGEDRQSSALPHP